MTAKLLEFNYRLSVVSELRAAILAERSHLLREFDQVAPIFWLIDAALTTNTLHDLCECYDAIQRTWKTGSEPIETTDW